MHSPTVLLTIICIQMFGPQARGQTSAINVVTKLYQDFAWESAMDLTFPEESYLINQPREVFLRYFDDSLTNLILKDRECAARTKEICNLDFDPIWASQDPAGTTVESITTIGQSIVLVKLKHWPSENQIGALRYHMTHSPIGWRIRDIQYAEGPTLRTLLETTLPK